MIVLPVIDRVCLSASSLDSKTEILSLAVSKSILGAYFPSALVSVINPSTLGISDFLANSGNLSVISLTSALVARVASLDFSKYLVSAVASLIKPVTEGISEVLANFSSPVRTGK